MNYNPKAYTPPMNIHKKSHFSDVDKLPRKKKKALKKKYGSVFTSRYKHLNFKEKLWFILSMENPEYHQFLINEITGYNNKFRDFTPPELNYKIPKRILNVISVHGLDGAITETSKELDEYEKLWSRYSGYGMEHAITCNRMLLERLKIIKETGKIFNYV